MFALNPWRETAKVAPPAPHLREEFKALYERFFNGWPMLPEPHAEERLWNLEVKETEKEVVVRAEVPGFELADLAVELRNNLLFITAEKKHPAEEKAPEYTERRYERILEVPLETDPAKVEASYRHGILEVHLPRTEEAKPLRIPVK